MTEAPRPLISLIIPAYNEESRLPASLKDIRAFFGGLGIAYECLVMVEKSSDRTVEVARQAIADTPAIEVIDNKVHKGKGYAVRTGMLRARGDFVFFMDADLSTPLSEVIAFMARFHADPDVDILIGSRKHADSEVIKRQRLIRQTLGRTFNLFVRKLGVPDIADTQCGFKAFRNATVREIFSRQTLNGFAFDVEVLLLARALGYKIEVVGVKWVNSPLSKVRIWIDPLKMLWDLFKVKMRVARSMRAQPKSGVISQPKY